MEDALLEAYGADDECEPCDFVFGYVEGWVACVVGDGAKVVFVGAWHEALDEEALFGCGDDVALVPLDEVAVADDGAGDDVAGVEVWRHGVACDLDHEIDVGVAEARDGVVVFDVGLGDGEVFVAEACGDGLRHQRHRFYVFFLCNSDIFSTFVVGDDGIGTGGAC